MEGIAKAPHVLAAGRRSVSALRGLLRLGELLRRSAVNLLAHDALYLAQSAAYNSIVAIFPALVVSAAVIALLPDVAPLKLAIGSFFGQVLPSDVFPLLTSYFTGTSIGAHTGRTLVPAVLVSVTGGSSVLVILMEGMRRALNLPKNCWNFWQRRIRSLLLVPLSLVPLLLATAAVIFGQRVTVWAVGSVGQTARPALLALAFLARWTIAVGAVVALTALIYGIGTPHRQTWRQTLPGAVVATGFWFLSTLAFGWYVTRFANYSQVYGPLGAGIALLFWLYLVFLSLLSGAEFNAVIDGRDAPGAPSG